MKVLLSIKISLELVEWIDGLSIIENGDDGTIPKRRASLCSACAIEHRSSGVNKTVVCSILNGRS